MKIADKERIVLGEGWLNWDRRGIFLESEGGELTHYFKGKRANKKHVRIVAEIIGAEKKTPGRDR